MDVTPEDEDEDLTTIIALSRSLAATNEVLVQVNKNLEILRKRTVWNRIATGLSAAVTVAVIFLGLGLVHESRQADQNLRLAILDSCNRSNELIARSNEQERTFVQALAQFTHADPQTVKDFQNVLKDLRGDNLDPIDCSKVV